MMSVGTGRPRLTSGVLQVAQSQILELHGSTRTWNRRQGSKECRKKTRVSENYEARISRIRSNFSRFSGATITESLKSHILVNGVTA